MEQYIFSQPFIGITLLAHPLWIMYVCSSAGPALHFFSTNTITVVEIWSPALW